MHGQGKYTWNDGRCYEGSYLNDQKHGYGSYTFSDGRRYDGQWGFGKQHGKGRYILPNGTEREGEWEAGKRTKWIEEGNKTDDKMMGDVDNPLEISAQKNETK